MCGCTHLQFMEGKCEAGKIEVEKRSFGSEQGTSCWGLFFGRKCWDAHTVSRWTWGTGVARFLGLQSKAEGWTLRGLNSNVGCYAGFRGCICGTVFCREVRPWRTPQQNNPYINGRIVKTAAKKVIVNDSYFVKNWSPKRSHSTIRRCG